MFIPDSADPVQRLAFHISLLLNPPTLGLVACLVFSVVFGVHAAETYRFFGISFTFGVLLPVLYLAYLKKSDLVESLDVPVRTQRTIPYLIASLSYAVGLLLLISTNAPVALVAFMFSFLGNTLIIMTINAFWKISAHTMGVGAVVTGFGIALSPVYFLGLALLPLVSWSRIKLDMHSRNQVVAGSLLSIVTTAIQYYLVYTYYRI